MALQIRCPSCQKLYAAEERMVGKKIRCRNCNNVFVVQAPAERAAPKAAQSEAGSEQREELAQQLDASNMTGTRKGMTVPEAQDKEPYEFKDLRPRLRPSLPQQFPGSVVLEAWLPLALALVAVVWSTAVSFGENESEKGWVPLVRIGTALVLYLLLIAPVTFALVKKNFSDFHRLLPPSPRFRTAATFAMPACFAYVFWIHQGRYATVVSLITGVILGVVFMAAVFWLLMRLDPQEAATAYAWSAGAFVVTVGISVGIVIGVNALLNQWMITGHADSFRESPLGAALAWTPPEPEKQRIRRVEQPMGSNLTSETAEPTAATQPTTGIGSNNEFAGKDSIMPERMPSLPPVTSPPKPREVGSDVFVSPDKDPFAVRVEEAKLPWVKHVGSPSGQSTFDAAISPLAASPFIGLLVNDNGLKLKVGQLSGGYAESVAPMSLGSINLPDQRSLCEHYALSADGTVCVQLNEYRLEIFVPGEAGGRSHQTIGLQVPEQGAGVRLRPSLQGVVRNSVVLRWSAPDRPLQYVQIYPYNPKGPTKSVAILDAPANPDAAAISANTEDQLWFASLVQIPRRKPVVKVYNISSQLVTARGKPPTLPLQAIRPAPSPSDVDPSQFENAQIAFSANGKQVACLMEQGDSGRLMWWTISATIGPAAQVSFKVPTGAEMGGKRGRNLQWLAPGLVIVHGQTLVNTTRRVVAGTLPPAASISSEQVVNDNTIALTYTGPDGHPHLDVVELDTDALMKNSPAPQ